MIKSLHNIEEGSSGLDQVFNSAGCSTISIIRCHCSLLMTGELIKKLTTALIPLFMSSDDLVQHRMPSSKALQEALISVRGSIRMTASTNPKKGSQ
jgi:hypothetical protein